MKWPCLLSEWDISMGLDSDRGLDQLFSIPLIPHHFHSDLSPRHFQLLLLHILSKYQHASNITTSTGGPTLTERLIVRKGGATGGSQVTQSILCDRMRIWGECIGWIAGVIGLMIALSIVMKERWRV